MSRFAPGPAAPVAAVIVSWNGRRFLPACLAALRASTITPHVIVVDNASTDGSAEYVRSEHPDVDLIELPENHGYAGGANRGLARASAAYALVMNPDVLLAPDCLAVLRDRLEADGRIGAAQGKLLRIDPAEFARGSLESTGVLDSAGHVVRRSRMVVDRGQGEPDGPLFDREVPVFSACGAALFLRMAMLRELAPDGEYFDEAFFAYKEDIDLCWRARLLGWDIRYIPGATAGHVRGWDGGLAARRRTPLHARRHSWKNHYLLMLKNDDPGSLLRAIPAVVAWEVGRLGYALLRDPAVLTAYVDLLRLAPGALRRRRELLARRRTTPAAMRRWFGAVPLDPGCAPVDPGCAPLDSGCAPVDPGRVPPDPELVCPSDGRWIP